MLVFYLQCDFISEIYRGEKRGFERDIERENMGRITDYIFVHTNWGSCAKRLYFVFSPFSFICFIITNKTFHCIYKYMETSSKIYSS